MYRFHLLLEAMAGHFKQTQPFKRQPHKKVRHTQTIKGLKGYPRMWMMEGIT